jgi:hypothetical protein
MQRMPKDICFLTYAILLGFTQGLFAPKSLDNSIIFSTAVLVCTKNDDSNINQRFLSIFLLHDLILISEYIKKIVDVSY